MADRVRLVVSGATGRMGRTLAELVGAEGTLDLVGGLDRDAGTAIAGATGYPQVVTPEEGGPLLAEADALVDFSAPSFLAGLLDAQAEALRGRAIVVGTTGLGAEEERRLERAAESSPVLVAANFSLGVNLLISLVERTARALGEEFDVEIVESHHRRKEDAPSGTALALGEAVARGRGVKLDDVRRDGRSGRPGARPAGEIGLHALRGGELIGEHEVHFVGDRERLELTHRAADRALFAAGALHAARWCVGRPPGRYTLRDVLGLD